MGCVPDLYTTGDNDPELESVQYYRHYLYCDACGSFELDPWITPDDSGRLETTRRRLANVALFLIPVAVVSGWEALGFFVSPTFLLVFALAIVISPPLRIIPELFRAERDSWRLRFAKGTLLLLPLVAITELLASDLIPSAWLLLLVTLIVITGLLISRAVIGSKIQYVGMRCRQCAATYVYGTPFFTDLDANPRKLTMDVVPRPLGSSPFQRGASVEMEKEPPPKRWSRLPQ